MHSFFILLFVLSLLIFKIFQFYYLVVASFGQKTISFSSQRRLDGQEYFQNACVFVRWTEDVWKNQMCTHMRQISSHMGTINNHMQWILAFITDWACVFPFLYYYFLIFFLWTRNISVALKNKYCNEKLQIINNRHKKCVCCYVCYCSNYWNDEKYSIKKLREKNRRISMLRGQDSVAIQINKSCVFMRTNLNFTPDNTLYQLSTFIASDEHKHKSSKSMKLLVPSRIAWREKLTWSIIYDRWRQIDFINLACKIRKMKRNKINSRH